jgi:hypothetical protein
MLPAPIIVATTRKPNVGYEHSVMKEKEHHEERSGSDRRDKDSRQARHN